MSTLSIEENNILIAEFMGKQDVLGVLQTEPFVTNVYFHANQIKSRIAQGVEVKLYYHSSWDWLMPVVEKIEQAARVDIYGKACKISQPQWVVDIAHINESKLTAVWICVVEFIQYINNKP